MSRALYWGLCWATRKRKYNEALDVLIDHAQNPRRIRAYHCPHCNAWHATSRPSQQEDAA